MNHANVVLDQPHLIDTLRFRVQVEKSLPQETVRIGVLVIVRGYERVQLQAVTRVSAAENHNLDERANAASREGLKLSEPVVSYELSSDKIGEVVDANRKFKRLF